MFEFYLVLFSYLFIVAFQFQVISVTVVGFSKLGSDPLQGHKLSIVS